MSKITFCLTLNTALSLGWGSCLWAQPPMVVNGNAIAMSEQCYRLTSKNKFQERGSAWCLMPIELQHAFEADFYVNWGCNKNGGEGVAFVLQHAPDTLQSLGAAGSRLGFGGDAQYKAIQPSLAIEFDTRYSLLEGVPDLSNDHITLIANGKIQANLVSPVTAKSNGGSLKDCLSHRVRISWKPSTQQLKVYVDNELRLTHTEDLINKYFRGHKSIYFGFTGATGAQSSNDQDICFNNITIEIDKAFAEFKKFEDAVYIYANPLTEQTLIATDFEQPQNITIQMYNSQGKIVHTLNYTNVKRKGFNINMAGLPSGIYFISVSNGKQRATKKIFHQAKDRA